MRTANQNDVVHELQPLLRSLEKLINAPEHSAVLIPIDDYGRTTDAHIALGDLRFRARYISRSYSNAIESAALKLQQEAQHSAVADIPVLIVPYMGPTGQEICARLSANWMDLAGNVNVRHDNLYWIVRGSPNKKSRRSGPRDIASPKGSRMIRRLLLEPEWHPTQRELALAVDVTEAYVSQFVGRLVRDGVVSKDKEARIRVVERDALLEAWREAYQLDRHQILKGFMFGRSGTELMHEVSDKLAVQQVRHAATGLAAAWLYDQFASFRLATFYVEQLPPPPVLQAIGFKEDRKAANVWLIAPNDPGVFDGETKVDGIPVVHAVQVYLDLKDLPERADEAADHLRGRVIGRGRNG